VPVTAPDLKRFKADGQRFVMLTAYDFQIAQIFDEAGIPVIFVGDTLGIFFGGYATTIPVTMDDMVHHCAAVSRAVKSALVVGDLPFASYHASTRDAVLNAARLVRDGGVQCVKLEGARPSVVAALVDAEIPVIGHLGLTPQSVNTLGGHRVQARHEDEVSALVDGAEALEAAGACAIVLEAVPTEAGRRVTEALSIPTIGIGAGPHCDGQVLVGAELIGLAAGPHPRFVKSYAEIRGVIGRAARQFAEEVATGVYPDPAHSYDWAIKT
jgi:3-methyl-2-oxobutanoate hydroxymethyltransferase